MTRVVVITLSCSDNDPKAEAALADYADEIADLADEAMESQEKNKNIPEGVSYEGTEVLDPDEEEAEIVDETKPESSNPN